jgi:hypothetical protein
LLFERLWWYDLVGGFILPSTEEGESS